MLFLPGPCSTQYWWEVSPVEIMPEPVCATHRSATRPQAGQVNAEDHQSSSAKEYKDLILMVLRQHVDRSSSSTPPLLWSHPSFVALTSGGGRLTTHAPEYHSGARNSFCDHCQVSGEDHAWELSVFEWPCGVLSLLRRLPEVNVSMSGVETRRRNPSYRSYVRAWSDEQGPRE